MGWFLCPVFIYFASKEATVLVEITFDAKRAECCAAIWLQFMCVMLRCGNWQWAHNAVPNVDYHWSLKQVCSVSLSRAAVHFAAVYFLISRMYSFYIFGFFSFKFFFFFFTKFDVLGKKILTLGLSLLWKWVATGFIVLTVFGVNIIVRLLLTVAVMLTLYSYVLTMSSLQADSELNQSIRLCYIDNSS